MSEAPADIAFNDGKAANALRTIGEVSTVLGIKQHVLRYWEEQFPSLRPVKRSGGRRYYRPEDVQLLATIDRLVHREGYTLRGAKQAISGKAEKKLGSTASSPAKLISVEPAIVDQLRIIRNNLAESLAAS